MVDVDAWEGTPWGLAPAGRSFDYVPAGLFPPWGVFRSFRAVPVMRHSDITISVVIALLL